MKGCNWGGPVPTDAPLFGEDARRARAAIELCEAEIDLYRIAEECGPCDLSAAARRVTEARHAYQELRR